MMRCLPFPAVCLALLGSCARGQSATPPAPYVAAPPPASLTSSMPPAAVPDMMDTRTPVPLLPMMANHQKQNMRDHLVAVQEIVAALGTDDFPAIEKTSARIGFSEQMGQMCTHMGAAAPGFTEQAITFHHTADRITAAAHSRDRARVLTEFAGTLKTCTSCHATWKQQVVDEPTWERLTASAPPTPDAPH